jgi:hypothetical protein
MPGAMLLPFGTACHTWLHHGCWDAWYAERRAHALQALAIWESPFLTGRPRPALQG